jgi:predicted metal-dependent hydrolase
MTKIIIEETEVEVIKKNVKNLNLSVHHPNGEVRLSIPKRMTDEEIRLFIISKIPWIRKHQQRFEKLEIVPKREFVSGETHYFFGIKYILNLIYQDKGKSKVIVRDKKYIDLYVKEKSSKEEREYIMKEWYRKELKLAIPFLIEKWEKIMNVKVNEFGVKQMKTRWGTCNTRDGRIWINLELTKLSPYFLEYIVVHEMSHLLEKGHGPKFKSIMDKYYPNWKNVKDELNGMIFL